MSTMPARTSSTRPYLIRALYEWCTDNGFTPYVAVRADDSVRVPREYVKDGEIVLNISMDATSALTIGNDYIEFRARFAGQAREILIPIGRVMAIYARENGEGMAFPLEPDLAYDVGEAGPPVHDASGAAAGESATLPPVALVTTDVTGSGEPESNPPRPTGGAGRPALKRVK